MTSVPSMTSYGVPSSGAGVRAAASVPCPDRDPVTDPNPRVNPMVFEPLLTPMLIPSPEKQRD